MPIKKGIKISSTKRGHHERHKKNFLKSKKTIQREKQVQQNIFKKSKNSLRKEQQNGVIVDKQKKVKKAPQQRPETTFKARDMRDMMQDDKSDTDNEREHHIPQKRVKIAGSDGSSNEDTSEDEELGEELELEQVRSTKDASNSIKKMKQMLPIKTKAGLVPQLVEDTKKIFHAEHKNVKVHTGASEIDEDQDSDQEILDLKSAKGKQPLKKKRKVLTATELLLEREQEIQRQKFRIGVVSSGILEKPEEKVKNLGALMALMSANGAEDEENLLSIRKLAMISLVEVFKDIIPDYKIGIVDLEAQKVKKDTLARVTYENELLKYFKNYLRSLENVIKSLKRRKYAPRPSKEDVALAEIAISCLCDAIVTHPYFNFSTNIAQLLVTYLNCSNEIVRKKIHETFVKLFKTDKRLDLSQHIVRHINHMVKKKSNFVFIEVISCLTALPLKSINVDAEKEAELKQKKLEQHKSRLISMSKRERKRKKKLADLEKEMMETRAEENKQSKNSKLTDISKLVFTIYFRILKQNPNSRLLSSTLEGLAKFAHIINIEFFEDLIEVLHHLIENEDLGYREKLHCIQTVFTILSGQGEVLNIDPARFYTHLYQNIMHVGAGKNHGDIESIITTLENVLIKRRKSMTHQRYLAFLKRLLTLSLQVLHNGTLGCLGIIKSAMQLNSTLDILLDTENKIGSGKFDPEIIEPEFSNANCTSFFELGLMRRHYHPTVVKMANHIANGVQLGNAHLEPAIAKLSPLELYKQFDSSEMSFNPPIPAPPKELKYKMVHGQHSFKLKDIEDLCTRKRKLDDDKEGNLSCNFYADLKSC